MLIESRHATITFVAIVMFAIPDTLYEIITFNLFKFSVFSPMTFKMQVNIMTYNVAEYVDGWRFY